MTCTPMHPERAPVPASDRSRSTPEQAVPMTPPPPDAETRTAAKSHLIVCADCTAGDYCAEGKELGVPELPWMIDLGDFGPLYWWVVNDPRTLPPDVRAAVEKVHADYRTRAALPAPREGMSAPKMVDCRICDGSGLRDGRSLCDACGATGKVDADVDFLLNYAAALYRRARESRAEGFVLGPECVDIQGPIFERIAGRLRALAGDGALGTALRAAVTDAPPGFAVVVSADEVRFMDFPGSRALVNEATRSLADILRATLTPERQR